MKQILNFFVTILKGFNKWEYIVNIHVLDIGALFDMHVIGYLDNSMLY